jgi:hypothetical protein
VLKSVETACSIKRICGERQWIIRLGSDESQCFGLRAAPIYFVDQNWIVPECGECGTEHSVTSTQFKHFSAWFS